MNVTLSIRPILRDLRSPRDAAEYERRNSQERADAALLELWSERVRANEARRREVKRIAQGRGK